MMSFLRTFFFFSYPQITESVEVFLTLLPKADSIFPPRFSGLAGSWLTHSHTHFNYPHTLRQLDYEPSKQMVQHVLDGPSVFVFQNVESYENYESELPPVSFATVMFIFRTVSDLTGAIWLQSDPPLPRPLAPSSTPTLQTLFVLWPWPC